MTTETAPADYPVAKPLLTGVLAEMIAAEAEAEGRRPQAADTVCRYSDAGRCGRAIGFAFLERTTGQRWSSDAREDPAGQYRMFLGKLIHEHVMGAIVDRYGGRVEVPSQLSEIASGHADWIGLVDDRRYAYELKSEGSYGFDRAVGLRRKNWDRQHPEGPRITARIQGALNAVANDCDVLVIGVVGMEAVSVALAEKVGLSNLDRIVAEWHYPRSLFERWAADELERMTEIARVLESGELPPALAVGDEGETVCLDPTHPKPDWRCGYCPYQQRCKETWG